ncbi:MATE family efflux transporter [Shewanella oneidensis MR-1]|uniref:Multidrug and toxin efflux protein MATE family n=1 Tax=Shewanella oneidensis (strain ATCC 700550 / JCM 31522 / CIP 106686 / LMG 19005 / NCIMB 14063 / MR-1) TaxID=211586 RepID=Q8EIN5_SHEON|nr:MATE family efflux transporter [Shewanella oneidensis]AAN53878.1 multidrug and toxin efflux protein MATE family [Shewanella oneidensis MR-1]MDX5997294.1 MATE family efflux transporter [Shewanella oneidensis]MEE2029064.1 putative FMN/FAD exporter YeeO [Shewanella oneidensis]QKG95665.1 MATE family efflux transporter [Shewanella oneidensis MR-1]
MATSAKTLQQRMGIIALTWPIFIETLLQSLLGISDIFMLSHYSDNAVAAVGLTTQLMFFMMVMSMMVSTGASILISQNNGAGRTQEATDIGVASVALSLGLAVVMGAAMFFCAHGIIGLFELEPKVAGYGYDYLLICGSLSIGLVMNIAFAAILRSYGFTRSAMLVTLSTGLMNVLGNYIALYSPFGLPVYGVTGVAISTVTSQLMGALIMLAVIRSKHIPLPMQRLNSLPRSTYWSVMRIGLLNAGEMLSYNVAQMTIIYFISQMGTLSLTAYTYGLNISRFIYCFSVALGQAAQIQTGYYVGKQWFDEITVRVQKYCLVGFIVSLAIVLIFFWQRFTIVGWLSENPEVIQLTALLLLGSIALETGRVFNLVIISALKGAGDVAFTVRVGLFSMWGIGVLLAWFFGLYLGYGVLAAWLAVAADEWVRGLIMVQRWRSGRWQRFTRIPPATSA